MAHIVTVSHTGVRYVEIGSPIFNIIKIYPPPPDFLPAACEVIYSASFTGSCGGDTFDCYSEGIIDIDVGLPSAGTGFSGLWFFGDTGSAPIGDTFDDYTTGSVYSEPLVSGSGFSGSWYIDNPSGSNDVVVMAGSFTSSYAILTTTRSLTAPPYVVSDTLSVLFVMHRYSITSGSEGWTLIANRKNDGWSGTNQWVSIYTRNDGFSGSFTFYQETASVMSMCLLSLASNVGRPVLLETSASTTYILSGSSPGYHPILALTASGNGRLGVHASSCAFTGTRYLMGQPWTQYTVPAMAGSRLCVATTYLSASQAINTPSASCIHTASSHDAGEVSLIFYT